MKTLSFKDYITKKVNELNLKTIVYTPYTKHIREILDVLKIDSTNEHFE